jgi:hypothetical protein
MLTADARFEGWTTTSWMRFLSLWKPRAEGVLDSTRPRGGVVLLREGERVLKVLHTRKGRIRPDVVTELLAGRPLDDLPLAELVREQEGSWGLVMHRGALDDVMEEFGARARQEHDLTDQSLLLVELIRNKLVDRQIVFWPQRLEGFPVPTPAMVRKSMDSICKDAECIILGLFENGELWTSALLHRRGIAFDVVAGPEDIRRQMGIISGDFRRDARYMVNAAEELYGPLSFGCFADVGDFRSLQIDPNPGAWSSAVALRKIILSPAPTAVGLALGVDAVRLAAENLRSLTERVDRFGLLPPLMQALRSKASQALGDRDLVEVLGFSPLDVLRVLIRR